MKTYKIIFSPTGGTAKVADAITANWSEVETIDLTDLNTDYHITLEEGSLALIAMPSFGGLAPQLALDRLSCLKANNSKCALAVVYGNRAYEDTLLQMKDTAEAAGFQVIAAVEAIAEHSIIRSFAAGRPNADDCSQLQGFGDSILAKAASTSGTIEVPGNKPYKKPGSAMVPSAGSGCNGCGACAAKCPIGAIDPANPKRADKDKCIGCMRCISVCPNKARKLNPVMTKMVTAFLKKSCSEVKQNKLLITM